MSKICIGIPSLGINEKFFDQKLEEKKKFGFDYLFYINYRDQEPIVSTPEKYKIPGFKIIHDEENFSMGNFSARYRMMKSFLDTDYEYLLTFDIDDQFINLNEDQLLGELGNLDYVKFRFDNVNIDPIETSDFDSLINKKFTVGIHNCLMRRSLVEKLVESLEDYYSHYFNFGEDIFFTTQVLNLIDTYKVSEVITAHYDDSGASFTYGKALAVSESIVNLFSNILPNKNTKLSPKFLEYLFLSNFSYILYEYYTRFKSTNLEN